MKPVVTVMAKNSAFTELSKKHPFTPERQSKVMFLLTRVSVMAAENHWVLLSTDGTTTGLTKNVVDPCLVISTSLGIVSSFFFLVLFPVFSIVLSLFLGVLVCHKIGKAPDHHSGSRGLVVLY